MLTVGSFSHAGLKRKDHPNQDAFETCLPGLFNPHPPLFIVADGMGGYNGGEIASQLVVKTIKEFYRHQPRGSADIQTILKKAIFKAHEAVINYAFEHEAMIQMGSTVVVAVIVEKKLYLGNVGDSRAYLINRKEIKSVSYDHSLVAELVRSGIVSPEEARVHPRKNVLSMSISAQRQTIEPYLAEMEIDPDEDQLLLCTDGLWGVVPEKEIQETVIHMAPQRAGRQLIDLANHYQGPDNITAVLVKMAPQQNKLP